MYWFILQSCWIPNEDVDFYSGILYYNHIEFSGAGLPLALLDVKAYDPVGPKNSTIKPPYSVVEGDAYFFDAGRSNPDIFMGSFLIPPQELGSCRTVQRTDTPNLSLTDVGSSISIRNLSGEGITIERRLQKNPSEELGVLPYYQSFGTYRKDEQIWRDPSTLQTLDEWEVTPLFSKNYPFGQAVNITIPGSVTDESSLYSSMPVPFSSVHDGTPHILPLQSLGVMLQWNGPRYTGEGFLIDTDKTEHRACFQFAPSLEAPQSFADCSEYTELVNEKPYNLGQMFTGPWDTTDGKVTFEWFPQTLNPDEVVSVTVRFLSAIDETSASFVNEVVPVAKSPLVEHAWNQAISAGDIPEGAECPSVGFRPALPCDENVDFVFNEMYRKGDEYISTLQGDPHKPLVDVTCRVDDSKGSFELSTDLLAEAISYAKEQNAGGAIFYINRTTTSEYTIPNIRDHHGNRQETGPLLVMTNSVQIGRFWFHKETFNEE